MCLPAEEELCRSGAKAGAETEPEVNPAGAERSEGQRLRCSARGEERYPACLPKRRREQAMREPGWPEANSLPAVLPETKRGGARPRAQRAKRTKVGRPRSKRGGAEPKGRQPLRAREVNPAEATEPGRRPGAEREGARPATEREPDWARERKVPLKRTRPICPEGRRSDEGASVATGQSGEERPELSGTEWSGEYR